MRRLWIFLTVLALIGPGPAFGQMGYAGYSCGKFGQQYGESPDVMEAIYFSWAQGFMFGMLVSAAASKDDPPDGKRFVKVLNSLTPPDFGVSAQKSFLRWYCDEHPLKLYATAVLALLEKIQDHQPEK